jgi:hypothetical protein
VLAQEVYFPCGHKVRVVAEHVRRGLRAVVEAENAAQEPSVSKVASQERGHANKDKDKQIHISFIYII